MEGASTRTSTRTTRSGPPGARRDAVRGHPHVAVDGGGGCSGPTSTSCPRAAAMAFAFGYPLVQVVRDSFYAGNFSSPIWVGLDNYKGVISTTRSSASRFSTTSSSCWRCPVMVGLGLFIALVLNDRIRGGRHYQGDHLPALRAARDRNRHRVLFPAAAERRAQHGPARRAPGSPRAGLARARTCHRLGRRAGDLAAARFRSRRLHSALLALPPETAEAARIDGAGWWSLQLRVLVPQIRPIIVLITVIQVITVISWVFNYVYVLTSGGPGYASSVMELYIWRSFSNGANGDGRRVSR